MRTQQKLPLPQVLKVLHLQVDFRLVRIIRIGDGRTETQVRHRPGACV